MYFFVISHRIPFSGGDIHQRDVIKIETEIKDEKDLENKILNHLRNKYPNSKILIIFKIKCLDQLFEKGKHFYVQYIAEDSKGNTIVRYQGHGSQLQFYISEVPMDGDPLEKIGRIIKDQFDYSNIRILDISEDSRDFENIMEFINKQKDN